MISTRIFVTPVPDGGIVLNEETGRPVSEAGEFVTNTPYIRRRLREGALILDTARNKTSKKKKENNK